MAKFGLELHGSGGKVFIGSNTSNPEGQKYIGRQVISVDGSDNSTESIQQVFHAVGKNSEKITLVLDGGTSIDILPQGIYQRFRNWFDDSLKVFIRFQLLMTLISELDSEGIQKQEKFV